MICSLTTVLIWRLQLTFLIKTFAKQLTIKFFLNLHKMTAKFCYAEAIYRTKMDSLCHGLVQLPGALLESYHTETYSFILKVLARVDSPNDQDLSKLEALSKKLLAEYKVVNGKKSRTLPHSDDKSDSVACANIPEELRTRLTLATKRPASLPLGMYLDEEEFIVGCYDSSNRTDPEVLIHGPPQFALKGNKDVVIGNDALEHGGDYKLYDLIKLIRAQQTFTHTMEVKDSKTFLRTEELIGKFFEGVYQIVKKKTGAISIPSLAVCLPFTSTALERQRLKEGARLSNTLKIRVISSNLATAISHSLTSGHFKNGSKIGDKFILSVQLLKQTFSMSIVRLGGTAVSTRCTIGLENLPQGQDQDFKSSHARLFQTSTLDGKHLDQIFKTYKTALEALISESNGCRLTDLSAALTCASKETVISVTLGRYLEKQIILLGNEKGPLFGACVLAAQGHIQTGFPNYVKVLETSRADLNVNFNGQEWKVNFRNKKFQPGLVFFHSFDPAMADKNYVVVQEEFCSKPKFYQDACLRFVSVEGLASKSNEKFQLKGTVDENGIYTLSLDCPANARAKLTRPDEQFQRQSTNVRTNLEHQDESASSS